MELPHKKRRLLGHGRADKELQARRAQQEQHLKSRFESIFEKYERDFTDLGDEIDLETGEIIVDNGHLQKMQYERDVGDGIDGQLVNLAYSDAENTDGQSSRSLAEDSDDNGANGSISTGQEHPLLDQTAFEGLDDYDELGDVPPAQQRVNALDADADLDELSMTNLDRVSPFGVANRTIWDESGDYIEPKWIAPPLPHERSKMRPLHRRLVLPMSLKLRRDHVDLSDWKQKHSIWDTRANSNEAVDTESDDEDLASVNRQQQDPDTSTLNAWTSDEEIQLRGLKASIRLSDEELVKYFPGKTINSLTARWNQLKASDQLQRELNARSEDIASSHPIARSGSGRLPFNKSKSEMNNPEHDQSHSSSGFILKRTETDSEASRQPLPEISNYRSGDRKPRTFPISVSNWPRREVPDSDSTLPSSSPLVVHEQANIKANRQNPIPIVHVLSDSEAETKEASNAKKVVRQKRHANLYARPTRARSSPALPAPDDSTQRRLSEVQQEHSTTSSTLVAQENHNLRCRGTAQTPTLTYTIEPRREIPDSQPSQTNSSSKIDPSTPKSNDKGSSILKRPDTSGRTPEPNRKTLKKPMNSSHRKVATPKSLKALRAAGSSQRSDVKGAKPSISLSQLCDDSDDDLSKPLPASAPETLKKPLSMTPVSTNAISREARDCSEDELG